jgi:transcriptional regulator with XRE-family HTH domain
VKGNKNMKRKGINVEIGNNLRTARKKARITQKAMSERLGVERSVYTRYETGDIEMPLGTFAMYCHVVGKSPDEILRNVNVDRR